MTTPTEVLWGDGVHLVEATDTTVVDVDVFASISGWDLRPEGLCNGDACVPVAGRTDVAGGPIEPAPGQVDLAAAARLLDRPVVVDPDAAVIAVGVPRADRRQALVNRQAPTFTLADLDGNPHSLDELRGDRTVMVTFSSWCGCRYDLPGWQELADELRDDGLAVVAVALDQDPDDVRPFTEGISLPVLIDPNHLLSELYAISNVPTVVWIDGDGRVARPNTPAFGTDTFVDFHGVPAGPHLDAIRRWVRTGDEGLPGDEGLSGDAGPQAPDTLDLNDEELEARLWFRIGAHLARTGRNDEATERLQRASELAPLDFTVARAAMPLTGRDPFGEEFLELYDRWIEAGSPYHGRPPDEGTYRAG